MGITEERVQPGSRLGRSKGCGVPLGAWRSRCTRKRKEAGEGRQESEKEGWQQEGPQEEPQSPTSYKE